MCFIWNLISILCSHLQNIPKSLSLSKETFLYFFLRLNFYMVLVNLLSIKWKSIGVSVRVCVRMLVRNSPNVTLLR